MVLAHSLLTAARYLWCQLQADLVSNPKDIFKYLYQNKIGEFVSLFYIGWAWVLESMGNYPQAHKIYLKATQKYVHSRATETERVLWNALA